MWANSKDAETQKTLDAAAPCKEPNLVVNDSCVMPGPEQGIHTPGFCVWMAGSSPAMTVAGYMSFFLRELVLALNEIFPEALCRSANGGVVVGHPHYTTHVVSHEMRFMRHNNPCRAAVSLKMRPFLRRCSAGRERPRWRPCVRLRGGFPLTALGLAPRAKYDWPSAAEHRQTQ